MDADQIATDIVRADAGLRHAIGAPDAVDEQWFYDRWLGAGTYGVAYEVTWDGFPAVFKLTRDVDECDVAEKTTDEDHRIRGLAYVHFLGWLESESAESAVWVPNCVVVTEKADTVLFGWRADALAACMYYLDRFDWRTDAKDYWSGLTQNLTGEHRRIAGVWVEDLREGLKWIGEVPIPDTNDGNAGLVERDGREMAVWVDFGQWG